MQRTARPRAPLQLRPRQLVLLCVPSRFLCCVPVAESFAVGVPIRLSTAFGGETDPKAVLAFHARFALSGVAGTGRGCLLVLSDAENSVGMGFYSPVLLGLRSSLDTYDCCARSDLPTPLGKARAAPASTRNATWLILPVVICLSQRLSHACVSMN